MNNDERSADNVRDAVRGVVADMRARERALWGGEPPRLGCFAAAALREANSRAAGERPGCLAFVAGCICGSVAVLVAVLVVRLILEALR